MLSWVTFKFFDYQIEFPWLEVVQILSMLGIQVLMKLRDHNNFLKVVWIDKTLKKHQRVQEYFKYTHTLQVLQDVTQNMFLYSTKSRK